MWPGVFASDNCRSYGNRRKQPVWEPINWSGNDFTLTDRSAIDYVRFFNFRTAFQDKLPYLVLFGSRGTKKPLTHVRILINRTWPIASVDYDAAACPRKQTDYLVSRALSTSFFKVATGLTRKRVALTSGIDLQRRFQEKEWCDKRCCGLLLHFSVILKLRALKMLTEIYDDNGDPSGVKGVQFSSSALKFNCYISTS